MPSPHESLNVNVPFEGSLFKKLTRLMEYYGIDTGKHLVTFLVTKEYREIFETSDHDDDIEFNALMTRLDESIKEELIVVIKEFLEKKR